MVVGSFRWSATAGCRIVSRIGVAAALALALAAPAAHAQLAPFLQILRNVVTPTSPAVPAPSPPHVSAPSQPYVHAPSVASPPRHYDVETIAELQRNLNLLGFDAGAVDGELGPSTTEALRAFQRSRHLPPDGIPTATTVAALQAEAQAGTVDDAVGAAPKLAEAEQPSFDCSRATTDAEITICRTPTLAHLDVELSQVYTDSRAKSSPAASRRLAAEQRAWLRERGACSHNVACLQRSFQNRIAELQVVAGPATASAAASADAASVAGQTVAADVGSVKPDTITAHLLNPPPGIVAIRLRSLDGWPLLTTDQSWARFLALIVAGSVPGLFEQRKNGSQVDYQEINLAQQLLEPSARSVLISAANWSGQDEFERARTRQRFEATYLPVIRAFAPKPPLSFAIALKIPLPQYDVARGGFNFGQVDIAQSLPAAAAGLHWAPQFRPPSVFWPIGAASAEHLLHSIAAAGSVQTKDLFRLPPSRAVSLVAVLEATHIDPQNGKTDLELKSVSVKTVDLRTQLNEFPLIKPELPPFLTAQIPAKLIVPTPTVMDAMVLHLAILRSLRNRTPGWVISDLWQLKAQADREFYQQADHLTDLQPNDARRPFFPPNNKEDRSEAVLARIKVWAQAYADGLPDEMLSQPYKFWGDTANGDTKIPVLQGSPLSSVPAALATSGLQAGQLIQLTADRASIVAILPNLSKFYSPVLPAQPRRKQPMIATTRYRLGSAQIVTQPGRSDPVVALHLEPLETDVTSGEQSILRQTYENIPHLDGGDTMLASAAETQTKTVPPSRELPLNAALIDLLTARSVGQRLSPEAQAYLVLRRWQYEDARGLLLKGPRFFKLGIPSPSSTQAVAMGPVFAQWAKANAPTLPLQVMVSGQVNVEGDPDRVPWGTMNCFGPSSFSELMGAANASMAANVALSECEDKKRRAKSGQTSWTGADARRCKALAIASAASASIIGFGNQCRAHDPGQPFPDPLVMRIEIPHVLPLPELPHVLGGRQQVSASASLEIDTVDLSDKPPSAADLLPKDIADLAGLESNAPAPAQQPGTPAPQFVVFGAKFLSADYRAADGHDLGHLGPDQGDSIIALVQAFHTDETQPAVVADAFAPDLSGVKLGMSFAEAERAIRKNMKVGRVLEGKRSSDPANIAPLTSGRLFIAEGGHDMIAIIDEPPASKDRVLAAWRRLTFPPGTVSLDSLLERVKQKYGPLQGYQSLHIGEPISWYGLAGGDCRTIYQYGPNRILADFWTGWTAAKLAVARLPILPSPLFAPLAQDSSSWMRCGPFVSATALSAKNAGGNDQLDLSLTDIGLYLTAYRKNHPQSGAGAQPAAPSSATPEIKF
ncbi:peptidoglycan-binding protein [Alcaligenaceae bacterium]|nr:peptidoglycan-binding protein [Alcaligenaceae bacterium]